MIYETNIVSYFFNVNVLTTSFCIKECLCILEIANIMFLSFIRFELLSFEHGNPISHKMWKKK